MRRGGEEIFPDVYIILALSIFVFYLILKSVFLK